MLHYNRIDMNSFNCLELIYNRIEGIDHAKSNNRKECTVCCYWYFNHAYKF